MERAHVAPGTSEVTNQDLLFLLLLPFPWVMYTNSNVP